MRGQGRTEVDPLPAEELLLLLIASQGRLVVGTEDHGLFQLHHHRGRSLLGHHQLAQQSLVFRLRLPDCRQTILFDNDPLLQRRSGPRGGARIGKPDRGGPVRQLCQPPRQGLFVACNLRSQGS